MVVELQQAAEGDMLIFRWREFCLNFTTVHSGQKVELKISHYTIVAREELS